MLDFVAGKLVSKKPTEAVVDVAGVGYRLLISTSAFERLPAPGSPVRMRCHLHVREDAMLLFGFSDEAERNVFNLLIGVSGVGPKLALAALSAMSPAEIGKCITTGDAAMLTRIPGVGRKTAERLVVDLRDRFDTAQIGEEGEAGVPGPTDARKDALSALEALGLSRKAAEKSLRDVLQKHPGIEAAEELIRLALRG
jgi:Holliday junction DNA helicase RuvA